MTIDKRALREVAEKATPGLGAAPHHCSMASR